MVTEFAFGGRDVRAAAKSLVLLNDGPRRDELAGLCTAMGWQVRDGRLEPSHASAQPIRQVIEFLARTDSPQRSVLVGYGEVGLAVLSVANRDPERVVAAVAIGVPFDSAVRSDAAKLSCPVMILPVDDPGDVVEAVEWFLRKRAEPPDQESD